MAKEKSIICSADEVKAILEGRQNVIRRVIKLENPGFYRDTTLLSDCTYQFNGHGTADFKFHKPCYQKGDLLWVRENWWDLGNMENGKWQGRHEYHTVKPRYVATCPDPFALGIGGVFQPSNIPLRQTVLLNSTWRKRPSTHMPKWAARLWLEVLDVWPERRQGESGPWAWRYEHKKVKH